KTLQAVGLVGRRSDHGGVRGECARFGPSGREVSGTMGTFHIDSEVENVRQSGRTLKVPKLLVDSGSEFTWVQEALLKSIGIHMAKKDQSFLMANGQAITRTVR